MIRLEVCPEQYVVGIRMRVFLQPGAEFVA